MLGAGIKGDFVNYGKFSLRLIVSSIFGAIFNLVMRFGVPSFLKH